MRGMGKKRLGTMLVESKLITAEQLNAALDEKKNSNEKLGEILLKDGYVTAEDIMKVLEEQTGVRRVNLNMLTIDKRAIKCLPESLCLKYDLIPFEFSENKIKVAMFDPLNIYAIDDISIVSGFEVETYIADKNEIKKAIEKSYSDEQVLKAAEELAKGKRGHAKNIEEVAEEELDDIKNAPVVKMVDYLIKNAMESRASDIHIEPYEKNIRIRYRIDGALNEISDIPIDSHAALITRIKILSNLNIAKKMIPQDGRIIMKIGNKTIDLRISILPTVFGEKVVMRLLDRSSYNISKEALGLETEDLEKLENIIKSPYGIILVTGPTGSGKSTTLYTFLNELNKVDKNIITIEDPVEYMLPGINQVNVNTQAGLTFAAGLRSVLRQDPDIVMIGEIRDSETAEIAIRAAITGHLVLSTLHTNDAPSTIMRLVDMGIEPFLVSTAVSGVIAQRLVRTICPQCKAAYMASEYEKNIMGLDKEAQLTLYKGKGCAYCNDIGYVGRKGIYEIMEITKVHKEAILSGKSNEHLKEISLKNGMKTIAMNCRNLVLKGETTIEELIKIAFLKD